MTNEQLRMQMLAGIITEGQYKEEVEEIEVRGKIGKSYSAPSTPKPIKNLQRIVNDISKKKLILGKSNDPEWNGQMVYFDDKDPFYSSLQKYTEDGGERIESLNRIPKMDPYLHPISQNEKITPINLNLLNLYKIISGVRTLIPLRGYANYMNDEDGEYILIEYPGEQGYISLGNVGDGLRKGTNYSLGMGFIFTLLS